MTTDQIVIYLVIPFWMLVMHVHPVIGMPGHLPR